MSHSDDEEEDIVVLQVCERCHGIENLEFDEETCASYCADCRHLFEQTKEKGFRILLSLDEMALVSLLLKKFDSDKKGYWNVSDWNEFASITSHESEEPLESDVDLQQFFLEEFDISLTKEGDTFVVRLVDLENMYGGFSFNQINALVEDTEALENAGLVDTGVLE